MRINLFICILCLLSQGCRRNSESLLWQSNLKDMPAIYLSESEISRAELSFDSALSFQADTHLIIPGIFAYPSESIKKVFAPVTGKIKIISGGIIRKGTMLATIESDLIVSLQQEYLDARNQYEYCKQEYSRQGDLTVENATSIKKMQMAQRDFQIAETKYHGLRLQLELLGLPIDSLQPENMERCLPVFAPSNGYILNTYAKQHSFVDKGDLIFEMITDRQLNMQFQIPEVYYRSISKGQVINCWWPYDSTQKVSAVITFVEKKIDPVSHTAIFYAKPVHESGWMMSGLAVHCAIPRLTEKVYRVHKKMTVSDKKADFIILKDKGRLFKIPVRPDPANRSLYEISTPGGIAVDSVVVKHQDYVFSLFK